MNDEIRTVDETAVSLYGDNFLCPLFFEEDTFWTTQRVMGAMFDVESNTIIYHLQEVYRSEELSETATTRKFRVVQKEGDRRVTREMQFYNLDAIISVGYRVNSAKATKFRQWATERLRSLIMSGIAERQEFKSLTEDERRIIVRQEMTEHNKSLAEAAKMSGVDTDRDYAIFQSEGYKGLYGGLGVKEIHEKKGLKKSQKILDFMGSTELAANLFRATQTDEKLRRENIQNKAEANQAHREVGKKVRQTIKELGGTMPEDLPTPEKSIKQIESAKAKLENKQPEDG